MIALAFPARALPALPAGAAIAAIPAQAHAADLYRKSCRSKVRRFYGPAKGRHTASLRLAYVEQCIAAGGRLR